MQKRTIRVEVWFTTEVDTPKLVKVKSYTRVRNGKKEKVRSHYRKY